MFEKIPDSMKRLTRWVNVKAGSKIPLRSDGAGAASSSASDTWSDFETASKAVGVLYDGIGFVFANDGIVGIDCDAGYDDAGFLSPLAVDLMRACRSYTERSRSGRGIHIYVRGTLPFSGRNNGAGVEIYESKRYFIVTGDRLIFSELTENQAGIDYILDKYFPDARSEAIRGMGGRRIYTPEYIRDDRGAIVCRYPTILPGMRNISLTSLAGALHNQGYPPQEIEAELSKANAEACKPPLPAAEVRAIVSSVTRYKR